MIALLTTQELHELLPYADMRQMLNQILARSEQQMATMAEFSAKLSALDAAVTAILAKVEELKAAQQNGGISALEETAVLEQIGSITAKLSPVPPPPPPPVG